MRRRDDAEELLFGALADEREAFAGAFDVREDAAELRGFLPLDALGPPADLARDGDFRAVDFLGCFFLGCFARFAAGDDFAALVRFAALLLVSPLPPAPAFESAVALASESPLPPALAPAFADLVDREGDFRAVDFLGCFFLGCFACFAGCFACFAAGDDFAALVRLPVLLLVSPLSPALAFESPVALASPPLLPPLAPAFDPPSAPPASFEPPPALDFSSSALLSLSAILPSFMRGLPRRPSCAISDHSISCVRSPGRDGWSDRSSTCRFRRNRRCPTASPADRSTSSRCHRLRGAWGSSRGASR